MTDNSRNKPLLLITGSTGLIGSRLIDTFIDDYTIVGLDINEPTSLPEGASYVECDLTDDDSVRESLRQVRDVHGETIASVIHLAAYYDFSGEPSPLYRKLTVEGTRRLIEGVRQHRMGPALRSRP